MLTAAMLAEHRDADALVALRRAADLSGWNDYASDEVRARIAPLTAANGDEPGGFSRVVTAQNVTLSHLLVLRRLAFVATALAVKREIAGDRDGGLEIRRAVARIGAKLLDRSDYLICAVRGADMMRIAAGRPCGAPALEKRSDNKDRYNAEIEAGYVACLDRTGHKDEATWFTEERSRADRALSILKIGDGRLNLGLADCYCLAYWWAAGLAVLTNVLAILLFGGLCAALARTPRIKSGLSMHRGVRSGLSVAILVPICAVATPVFFGDTSSAAVPTEIVVFGGAVVALTLFLLKRNESWRGLAKNVAVFLATVTSALALLTMFCWLGTGLLTPLSALTNLCGGRYFGLSWPDLGIESMLAAIVLTIPLFAALFLAIRSRVNRIPISVGVVHGMRDIALTVAAPLLFVYGIVLCGTVVQDTTTRQHADERLRLGAGRASAKLIGADWPTDAAATASAR